MTLYETLGVSPTATPAEIKAAARAKQKATHPDTGGDTAAFQDVQNAVRVLSDPDKRAHYDRTGEADTSNRSPEERDRTEAASILAQLMNELMAGDPRFVDLPKQVAQRADKELSAGKQKLAAMEAQAAVQLKKADAFINRLKRKGDADPTMEDILRNQRAQVEQALQAARTNHARATGLWERVKALANGYEYEAEAQPPPNYDNLGNWNQMRDIMGALDREFPRGRPYR